MYKESTETPAVLEAVKGERVEPSGFVRMGSLLIFAVIVPLVVLFHYFERLTVVAILILVLFLPYVILFSMTGRPKDLRVLIALIVLGVFSFAVMATFDVVVFWGLGTLKLPEAFVHWLGVVTVGEIAGLLVIIVRRIFPKDSPPVPL